MVVRFTLGTIIVCVYCMCINKNVLLSPSHPKHAVGMQVCTRQTQLCMQ